MDILELKKQISYTAVDTLVKDNMKLGLGTGSTAIWVTRRIGELLSHNKLHNIIAVPTSLQTKQECATLGIPAFSMSDPSINGELDLTIDGADEISPERKLIKGGGGALLREKICAYASRSFAIVADESKMVDKLGAVFPVPIEVVPEALFIVQKKIEKLGGKPVLRRGKNTTEPFITDNNNCILDTAFGGIDNPDELEKTLKSIVGIVESGIFSRTVTHIFLGKQNGEIDIL